MYIQKNKNAFYPITPYYISRIKGSTLLRTLLQPYYRPCYPITKTLLQNKKQDDPPR